MKKLSFLSLMVAMALSLSVIESLIPLPFIAPGVKLGISNIVILICIVFFGFKDSLIVGVLKSILLMLVTGAVTSFFYSLAGSLLSVISMNFAYKKIKSLSLIGVSLIGSSFHSIGQLLVASIMLENIKMFNYLPILLLVGIFSGYFVGISSIFTCEKLKKINIFNELMVDNNEKKQLR
ncbi:Gx transporter family protein [Citroniella saccharovorans]|uniref:Gx transporter family protein n=1 Tax=Citroniella saccharovorans TaxID=2053367 RepID=A0AAW9MZH0_9FIRM|nr:Gx transporter family protein [Citroniella saccharovorans]MEB3429884.1 Gx transporter family protein [Citroniella saccharovorans]